MILHCNILVLGVNLGALAKPRVPFFSSKIVEWTMAGFIKFRFNLAPISFNILSIGTKSLIAVESAIYSASKVLRAISVCNLETQVTGHPPSVMTYPVQDLTHMGSWSDS